MQVAPETMNAATAVPSSILGGRLVVNFGPHPVHFSKPHDIGSKNPANGLYGRVFVRHRILFSGAALGNGAKRAMTPDLHAKSRSENGHRP
jgi:hypothetical protein